MSHRFSFSVTLAVILALVLSTVAMAAVKTDQPDYNPGSTVTISGDNSDNAGWQAGETVNVAVSGPNGQSLSCSVVVASDGTWSCQVTLSSDPADAGNYTYTAAGATSNASQDGSFTVTAPPPTFEPSPVPTAVPTLAPTDVPTTAPTDVPTVPATVAPSDTATAVPPTTAPTDTAQPPTVAPSETATVAPTEAPTQIPTATQPAPSNPPFIQSDLLDYNPGQLVMLTSGNWLPGESVLVYVNDEIGQTWSISVDKVADANGQFTYQFNLPNWFVATYYVTATGDHSRLASTTFTDSKPNAVTVGAQQTNPVIGGNSTDYPVTVNFNGNNNSCTADLTVSGLPAGASGSFSANPITTTGGNVNVTLTIHTTAGTTSAGTTNGITVTATGRSGCQNPLSATSPVFSLVVSLAPSTTTFGTVPTPTYLGGNFTVSATNNSGGSISYSKVSGPCLVVNGSTGTFSSSGAGSCVVQASSAATSFYAASSAQQIVTIAKATPTITWADPAGITYGAALSGTQLNASANTGGSFVYTPATGTVLAAGNNQTLHVAFTPTNMTDFTSASKDVSINVLKLALTVTADAKTKAYGDGDPVLTYAFTPALVTGDSFTGALSRVAGENSGTYAIQQGSLTAGSNYSITYVGANLTINKRAVTVIADAKTKVYGDTDPALTYQITTGSLASGDSFSGALTRAAGESVSGSPYAIQQGTLALSSNYTLTYVSANLSITKAQLTVTADNQSRNYGDPNPMFSASYSGFKNGETLATSGVTGAPSLTTTVDASSPIGSYPITAAVGTLSAGNYGFSFVNGMLTVGTRPVTVTADAESKTYGDADPSLTYQITSGSLVNGDTFTGALTRDAGENVGVYAIKQGTLALSANYALTYVGANLTIGKRAVTVTADAKTKVYGAVDPGLTYQITSGSLAFSDAFTGALSRDAGESVAQYDIKQATLALSANYDLSYVGAKLTITPATLTVTAGSQTKVYGDADPALTYVATGFQFSDNQSLLTGALSRAAGEDVGTYAVLQGTLAANSNYTISFTGNNLTITVRALTVTADPQAKIYGDSDPALTYQVTAGSLAFSDAFTGSLSRVAGEGVGTYAIGQGTLALNGNYALAYVGADLSITKRAVEITADPKSKTYGDADPALTYQVSSGSLVFSDAFSGSLSRDPGQDVGTYAITQGSVALNSNYTLTYAGADLTITQRSITITADGKSKIYGDSDPLLTYQITSGSLAFTDNFTGSLARVSGENVGTYAIQQGTVALNGNYDLSYVGADLTITFRPVTVSADAQSKTYGEADPALTYQISSGSLAFTDHFAGALARDPGENVGSYAITQGTLVLNGNYTLSYIGATLTINKLAVTVTADGQTKVYGDADPALTYAFTPALVSGDSFSGSLTRDAGEDVGTHAITQGTLALSSNYDVTYVGANLTITKRPVEITADPQTKVYGNPDPALTYQITSGNVVNGDTFSGSLFRVLGENVGSYGILQGTVTLSPNYQLSFISGELAITARPITVMADPQTKVYGDNDPSLTYQATGTLQFSDAFTGALTRDAGQDVGSYAITQGTLALSSNYALTYVGADLTITARPITVTADPQSKTYGDPDPLLTYQVTGTLQFGDLFTGALARDPGEHVGDYSIAQGTLVLSSNYDLTYVGAKLTINPLTIHVTAAAKSKVYGENDPALTYTFTPSLLNGDAFSGGLTRNAGQDVGTYAITQGTLALSSDYALVYSGDNLTITKRPITITADAKTKVYGQSDPALTYHLSAGTLAFSDAFAGSLARNAGEDVGDHAIMQGTVALSDNYTLTFVGANLTITPATLTVKVDLQTKVYGSADPALTYVATGFQFSDTGTSVLTGELARDAGQNVGPYNINQGNLAANPNYTIAFTGNTLAITPATLAITADHQTKVYGAGDPALTYAVDGLQYSDTPGSVLSDALTRAAGQDVGTYAISQGSLSANSNYTITFTGNTLEITPATLSVTADHQMKVYGEGDPALTYIASGFQFDDNESVLTGGLTRASGESVGSYAIAQGTLAANTNYSIAFTGNSLAITKAVLTVTAEDKSRIYGDANPVFTASYSGFKNGETLATSGVTGAPSLTTAAGANSPVAGPYAIIAASGNLAANNYSFSFINGKLIITKAVLTITADNKSRTYGDANPTFTASYSGFKNGENLATSGVTGVPSLTTAATAASPVGLYTTTAAVGSLAANNYSFTFVNGSLTVNTRALLITANNQTKVLGATFTFAGNEFVSSGLVNSDSVTSVTLISAGAPAPATVGSYPIVPSAAVGSGLSNYSITYANGTMTVQYAPLGGTCLGSAGHAILQPVNADGTSVFKQGSTVPAKFRVCDANGNSIGTAGLVSAFRLVQTKSGTVVNTVDEVVDSTTPYAEFRWSSSDQQWIFNMSTKSLKANYTYYYDIALNDGSHIYFQFGLK